MLNRSAYFKLTLANLQTLFDIFPEFLRAIYEMVCRTLSQIPFWLLRWGKNLTEQKQLGQKTNNHN
jgi:hypothetical protein